MYGGVRAGAREGPGYSMCARHGAERQAWRANAHLNSEIWPTLVDARPSNESGCLRSLENR